MIQKLKKEIPHKILELMSVGINKDAFPEFFHKPAAIMLGVVTAANMKAINYDKVKPCRKKQPSIPSISEPEGLSHHFWR